MTKEIRMLKRRNIFSSLDIRHSSFSKSRQSHSSSDLAHLRLSERFALLDRLLHSAPLSCRAKSRHLLLSVRRVCHRLAVRDSSASLGMTEVVAAAPCRVRSATGRYLQSQATGDFRHLRLSERFAFLDRLLHPAQDKFLKKFDVVWVDNLPVDLD